VNLYCDPALPGCGEAAEIVRFDPEGQLKLQGVTQESEP
jgi:hypothetical protein